MKIEKAEHIAKTQIISTNCDVMISFRLDGIIFHWNAVAENIFGYPAIEAIGRNIAILFPINYFKDPQAFISEPGENSKEYETVCKTKEGDRINLLFHVFPVNSETETLQGISLIAKDITDTKRAEEKQAILSSIVSSSDDAIISKNLKGIITSWNKAATDIFGYSEQEAIGQNISIIIPFESKVEEELIIESIRKGEKIDHFETFRVAKDGTEKLVSLTVSPVKNRKGEIIGASKILRDLTEKDNDDERQATLAAIVTSSDDAIISKTLDGIITSWNHSATIMFGYTPEEAIGKHISFIIPKDRMDEETNIIQNIPSAKINFANKKLKLNIGSGFGFTHFDLKDVTFGKDYLRNYTNFYPSANATYTYKPNHSIRFSYDGSTAQPTVDQLQPLRNNNNYFNQVIGNPALKPSFTNSFNISHQSYNFLKDFYTYQSINVQMVQNAITTSSTVDLDSGKTISQAVNVNGNYSVNFYGGMGFRIKKIDTRFNVAPNFNFDRYASIINGVKGYAQTSSPGINASIYKSKEKKYDLSVWDQFSYNSNTTTQNDTKIHYYTNTLSLNGTLYFKKVWSLITDYEYSFRQKTIQSNSNLITNIWNAQFQRTFKHDEYTIYFKVRDILDQNIGIQRNFYGNTYTQQTNDRLKRYFMIGFTWNFKNKGSK